jgi:prepilin-type N-terminal cleavage/methylation domain-containing protein
MPHHRLRSTAFTLVELSIVLAIVGLVVGGIMAGTGMLKQSELKSATAEYSKYSAAVAQFNQQYGGLPGDLLDATNYWGDDNAACADATVTDGTPGTCNGDSDGDMSDGDEPYRAWQQLVLANFISGSFTGVISGGGAVPGTNTPKSAISSAGWSFGNKATTAANANDYDNGLSNFLALGAPIASALTQAAAITPQDAWQVDTKFDDGSPSLGRIMTRKPAALTNCASSAVDATATYNRPFTGIACSLNMSLTLN